MNIRENESHCWSNSCNTVSSLLPEMFRVMQTYMMHQKIWKTVEEALWFVVYCTTLASAQRKQRLHHPPEWVQVDECCTGCHPSVLQCWFQYQASRLFLTHSWRFWLVSAIKVQQGWGQPSEPRDAGGSSTSTLKMFHISRRVETEERQVVQHCPHVRRSGKSWHVRFLFCFTSSFDFICT